MESNKLFRFRERKGPVSHLGNPPWDRGRHYWKTHGPEILAVVLPEGEIPQEEIYAGVLPEGEMLFRIAMTLEEYSKRCRDGQTKAEQHKLIVKQSNKQNIVSCFTV